jgi:hypothetical protein
VGLATDAVRSACLANCSVLACGRSAVAAAESADNSQQECALFTPASRCNLQGDEVAGKADGP